jgi:hypothetical protein
MMFYSLEDDCPGFLNKDLLDDGKLNLSRTEYKITVLGFSKLRAVQLQYHDKSYKKFDIIDILET